MCALVKWWPNAIPQSLVFHNFNHENVVKIIVNMSRHSLNLVKYNMVGSGGKDQFRGGLTMPAAEVLPLVRKFITHLPISLNLDANLKQNVQCHFYTRSRFQIPEPRKMDRLRNTMVCCSSHPTVSGCSLWPWMTVWLNYLPVLDVHLRYLQYSLLYSQLSVPRCECQL